MSLPGIAAQTYMVLAVDTQAMALQLRHMWFLQLTHKPWQSLVGEVGVHSKQQTPVSAAVHHFFSVDAAVPRVGPENPFMDLDSPQASASNASNDQDWQLPAQLGQAGRDAVMYAQVRVIHLVRYKL